MDRSLLLPSFLCRLTLLKFVLTRAVCCQELARSATSLLSWVGPMHQCLGQKQPSVEYSFSLTAMSNWCWSLPLFYHTAVEMKYLLHIAYFSKPIISSRGSFFLCWKELFSTHRSFSRDFDSQLLNKVAFPSCKSKFQLINTGSFTECATWKRKRQ